MSKLSDKVKSMQAEDAKKDINFWFNNEDKRQEFLDAFFDKLSNLEFDSLKSVGVFYIEICPFMDFDGTLVARLLRSKTDYIELGLFPNAAQEQYSLDKNFLVTLHVSPERINLEELQYYCEKTAKAYTTCKVKLDEEKSKTVETNPDIEQATRILEVAVKGLNNLFKALDN